MRALVTGASSGIGYEIAKLLAADGYDLVLVARSTQSLEQAAEKLRREFSVSIQTIAYDLACSNAAEAVFERAPETDILINNAGVGLNGPFADSDKEQELGMIRLNVETLVHLTKLYLPQMIKRQSGRILNVASIAGFLPGPYMANYYASKAYVRSFSLALAYELRGTGVTVTCLSPGVTNTNFFNRAKMHTIGSESQSMTSHEVAAIGYRALKQGKAEVVAGYMNAILVRLLTRFLPVLLMTKISAFMNRNSSS